MRLVHLSRIKPGMVIARAVYGPNGQKLITEGAELKDNHLRYLRQSGISQIYVQDTMTEDVVIEDIVAETTRLEVRTAAKDIIMKSNGTGATGNNGLIEDRVGTSVDHLFNELADNPNAVVSLADIRSVDNYTFEHSLNVTVLSILTAMKLNYPRDKIRNDAAGILLHDLGLKKVPEEILNKKGALTDEERDIVKKHPVYGYELFKDTALFSESAGAIISQHHERIQGQGYPDGREKDDINWMAQVVAIADTYDALTSFRPYRKPFRPYEAMNILIKDAGSFYNPDILKAFFSFVSAYPLGAHVLLNNGESGLVTANTPGYPYRPTVRVIYQEDNHPHPCPYEVDLKERADLSVAGEMDKTDKMDIAEQG